MKGKMTSSDVLPSISFGIESTGKHIIGLHSLTSIFRNTTSHSSPHALMQTLTVRTQQTAYRSVPLTLRHLDRDIRKGENRSERGISMNSTNGLLLEEIRESTVLYPLCNYCGTLKSGILHSDAHLKGFSQNCAHPHLQTLSFLIGSLQRCVKQMQRRTRIPSFFLKKNKNKIMQQACLHCITARMSYTRVAEPPQNSAPASSHS